MAGSKLLFLCAMVVLTLFSTPAVATVYTRFEDLPKCGQDVLRDGIAYALKKSDCGTSLYCACRSSDYSSWVLSYITQKPPCSTPQTANDILVFNQDYYCNAKSDQRVRYTLTVEGTKKTLTLQPSTVVTTVTAHPSDSSTAPDSATHMSSTTSRYTSTTSTTTTHTTSTKTSTTSATATSHSHSTTASTSTSTSSDDEFTTSSSTSSKSTSMEITSSASSTSVASTSPDVTQAATMPSEVGVVTANTTIMGHTATVKSTIGVTATVHSGGGSGPLRYFGGASEEKFILAMGLCFAWMAGFMFLMAA